MGEKSAAPTADDLEFALRMQIKQSSVFQGLWKGFLRTVIIFWGESPKTHLLSRLANSTGHLVSTRFMFDSRYVYTFEDVAGAPLTNGIGMVSHQSIE